MPATRHDLQEKVIEKAMKDATFKKSLLKNPRESLARELGIQIPKDVTIHVVEENDRNFYLVLPQAHTRDADEPNMVELEAVVGGVRVCSYTASSRC